MLRGQSLKARFIGALVLVLLVTVAGSAYLTRAGHVRQLVQSAEARMASAVAVFESAVESDAEGLARAHTVLGRSEPLLAALAARDREALLALATPLFQELKSANAVTHMYFIEPDGRVLLRVHKPQEHGDVLTRATWRAAARNGRGAHGIEMGKNFFSLRSVRAVAYQGRPVGYFELAEEIDHLFARAKQVSGADVAFFLADDYARAKGFAGSTEQVGAYHLLEGTDRPRALELARKAGLEKGRDALAVQLVDDADATYVVGVAPLRDAAGDAAGVLLFTYDETALQAAARQQGWATIALFAAMLVASGVLLFGALRRSLAALARAVDVSARVASGDLTVAVAGEGRDEAGRLLGAMGETVARLREAVRHVRGVGSGVAVGSRDLSESAAVISRSSSEQAASADEAVASVEQITATIRRNAETADAVETLALSSARAAEEGGRAVTEAVVAMRQVAGHTAIVQEMAYRTNLLALNAAIEAARAGQHGRGFAVVAAEVRKLAEQSRDAAAQIGKMTGSSVAVAERAGEQLSRLVPDIQGTAERVRGIAAATRELAAGASVISDSVRTMNAGAQANAAAAQEIASTSLQLNSRAEELEAAIRFFRVEEAVAEPRPRGAA